MQKIVIREFKDMGGLFPKSSAGSHLGIFD